MIIKNKKANITILILVLMTLVLAGATLLVFNINQGKIETKIENYAFLNSVYLKENQMDFYINNILDDVIKNFEVNEGKDKFVEKFKIELEKYKQTDGSYSIKELEEVNKQVDDIIFDDINKRIILNLDIKLDEEPNQNMKIAYAYKKTFEKDL
jgi:hypothetical protein